MNAGVQNILSNFEENDPDRGVVLTAWERMVDVARHINELKRQHERLARTHELRTSLDGSVNIISFGELILEVIRGPFFVAYQVGVWYVIVVVAWLIYRKLTGLAWKINN